MFFGTADACSLLLLVDLGDHMGADSFRATGTPTVLVVDDEDSLRMLMRQVLEDAGYQVCEAHEGHMAALTPRVPILFVSGFVSEVETSALPGQVLAKPFIPEQLVSGVRQAQCRLP